MNIKNRIKLSFVLIIILVLAVGIISVGILYQVKKNNLVKDKISQIILIQERMNEATTAQIHLKNIEQIDQIKIEFDNYEKTFEKIKDEIPINENFSEISTLFKDEQKHFTIIEDLNTLFANEHKIEVAFESMYTLQESYIKLQTQFETLYPMENDIRKQIEQEITQTVNNYELMKLFGQVQYYSKETLYQHQDELTFSKWLNASLLLDKSLQSDSSKTYSNVVKEIGKIAIDIRVTDEKRENLLENINIVLKEDKQIALQISQTIEELSASATNKAFILLFLIIVGTLLFISFFSYIISKKVSLSVDEIELEIKKGLEEIQFLNKEISDTQKEVIFTMGAIGEQRSKETGNHVKRVAEYSKTLALHYGLDHEIAEMLKQASPMHDIGKVAIPDAILNKPGRFEPDERTIMETHADLGYQMLKNSSRPLLKMASTISLEHHEKWDGTGYPQGLKEEQISIYGRITALADVFDALGSDRVYKKAWDNEKIFALFKEERGKHFEPKLVDIFFENLDEFLKIQERFKDTPTNA